MAEPLTRASARGVPCEEEPAAAAARAGPEVDHVVGGLDRLRIVLDDDDGVAAVGQAPQDREQPARVGGVEADRRLVEDVERARSATPPSAEARPIRCASPPESVRAGAREREVLEADVVHVAHARA